MLTFFRRGIMAKLMLGVLFLTLVAMVITGFGTGGGGMGDLGGLRSGTVAKVGGEKLESDFVKRMVDREFRRLRQQMPELDMAGFLKRLPLSEVVEQLIDGTAALAFGREQGLGVSRAMIDREIAGEPSFHNFAGTFDEATFRRALQEMGMSEAQLREEMERNLLQRQLLIPVQLNAHVPTSLAYQYASLLLETRSGIVGAVPTAAMGPGAEPTAAELAAFYRTHRVRYTIPERRVIRYAVFGPESVAAQAQATDAEIQAAYAKNPAYAARETRRLSQVVMQDQAAVRAIAAKVAAGTSFADAAALAKRSARDTALGTLTREAFAALASPEVAAAAFGAAKGATVGPVRSKIGWHVVKVEDVIVAPARPLASVRAEIAAQVGQQKAAAAVSDLTSRIEEAVRDGASFDEVVAAQKLKVVETVPVTATGAAPGTANWQAPPELQPLLEAAFAGEPGDDPTVEALPDNQRFALVTVTRAVPAAAPPLAAIADRVKNDLIVRRASERAKAVAAAIVARINSGMAPAQAFAQAQVRLPAVENITAVRRDISTPDAKVPPQLAMLFSLPRGKARLLPAPEGRGWFVVYLDRIVPGDARKEPDLVPGVGREFSQLFSAEYAEQFMNAVRGTLKVKRNDDAMRQVEADLLGTGPVQ